MFKNENFEEHCTDQAFVAFKFLKRMSNPNPELLIIAGPNGGGQDDVHQYLFAGVHECP
jgi:hypothetical protein